MRIISYTQPPTTSMVNGDVRKCFFFFCAGEKDDELVHTQTNGNQIHIIGLYLENHLCGFCDQQLITATTTTKNKQNYVLTGNKFARKHVLLLTCLFVACAYLFGKGNRIRTAIAHTTKYPTKRPSLSFDNVCVCVCLRACYRSKYPQQYVRGVFEWGLHCGNIMHRQHVPRAAIVPGRCQADSMCVRSAAAHKSIPENLINI